MIKPGDVLLNGAEVISVLHFTNMESLVLCYWEGNPSPWVTWRADTQGYTYWGNYYKTADGAAEDFNKRALRLHSELEFIKSGAGI